MTTKKKNKIDTRKVRKLVGSEWIWVDEPLHPEELLEGPPAVFPEGSTSNRPINVTVYGKEGAPIVDAQRIEKPLPEVDNFWDGTNDNDEEED
jgi:hypothetical protein